MTSSPSPSSPPLSNAPEWSVSDLSGVLKRTVEEAFGHVRLRGEISGYRGPHSSGHVYFALKDAGAKIDAVIWKGAFAKMRIRPQEGLEVVATGRITTYPGKSSYQIIIEALEPAGAGALMALLEERRRVLAAEGLFAPERKKALPFLPRVIGVVTSPTGAVIRDILHRLSDRFASHVLVWPVRVQGETAGDEVARAIRGFNGLSQHSGIPRPDVLIVARGGGSLEDLWSFNDEAVVRAAADSAIPLISAIGHETDWTLIDLAADYRAPTPTAAAEKAVPVRVELLAWVGDLARRHHEAILRGIQTRRAEFRSLARALPSPDALLGVRRQRLDLSSARLPAALRRNARGHEQRLHGLAQRLQRFSPQVRLATLRERLSGLDQRLIASRSALMRTERLRLKGRRDQLFALQGRLRLAEQAFVMHRADQLERAWALCRSLSHESVLQRGFALVRDEASGQLVRQAGDVNAEARLTLRFADGEVRAVAQG